MTPPDGPGPIPELRTERLLLRAWKPEDRSPFAELNADPEVMGHYPSVLSRAASDALVDRIEAAWAAGGPSLWALEVPGEQPFIGYVGLLEATFTADFTPCIEVGWRLARRAWGKGYATEAATAALDHGFGSLGLGAICSFTTVGNLRSRRVMEKLGLRHDPAEDFDHPSLPERHPLRRHVLYRLDAAGWRALRTRRSGESPSASGTGPGRDRGTPLTGGAPFDAEVSER